MKRNNLYDFFHHDLTARGFNRSNLHLPETIKSPLIVESPSLPYWHYYNAKEFVEHMNSKPEKDGNWSVVFGYVVHPCRNGKNHLTFNCFTMVRDPTGVIFDVNPIAYDAPHWKIDTGKWEDVRIFLEDPQMNQRAMSYLLVFLREKELWMPPAGRCIKCEAQVRREYLCGSDHPFPVMRREVLHFVAAHPDFHYIEGSTYHTQEGVLYSAWLDTVEKMERARVDFQWFDWGMIEMFFKEIFEQMWQKRKEESQ